MSAARWVMPPLLRLDPEQAAAVAGLAEFAAGHPGVRILTPHYNDEPWRADIRKGAVPGDDRAMLLTAHLPGELLAKLAGLFPRPG